MAGYVSDDLVHFVGSHQPANAGVNWNTLKAILDSGEIRAGRASESGIPGFQATTLTRNLHRPLSSNDRYLASVACFADIPEDQLSVHTGKYGRFGLALSKQYLIPRGVRPVTYLPRGAGTGVFARRPNVEDEWDEMAPLIEQKVFRLFGGNAGDANEEEQVRIDDWVEFGVLAYVKFFDPALSEADPDNYYMEREWRSTTAIPFTITDVTTLYVPDGFARTVAVELPAFTGRVSELM